MGKWVSHDSTQTRKTRCLLLVLHSHWIGWTRTLLLKRVKIESKPTDYFPKKEFEALVDATYAYGNWLGGHDYEHRRDRVRALVLLMRWSGLAIKDAVTLERTRVDDDGSVFLYRAKTGVPVMCHCRQTSIAS
jgi:integrase/recombinase XerD